MKIPKQEYTAEFKALAVQRVHGGPELARAEASRRQRKAAQSWTHSRPSAVRRISHFALMADREDEDRVFVQLVAVESDVACLTSGDHELPEAGLGRPPDERMTPQHVDGFLDEAECLQGGFRVRLDQKVRQPFEVFDRLPRIDQPRHCLAFGRGMRLPAMRSRM